MFTIALVFLFLVKIFNCIVTLMIQSQVLSNNFEAEKRGNIKSLDKKKQKKKQDKINYSIYETF